MENQGPISTLIARFMGPIWGPSGAVRTQVGPILASWTLLSGNINIFFPDVEISIIRMRESWGHLIFVTRILILIRWHIYIETATHHLSSCHLNQSLTSCQLCHRWLPWMLSWQKPEVPLVFCDKGSLIARFLGPTWGPSGTDRTQVGPMLAPWTLLAGVSFGEFQAWCILYVDYFFTLSMFQLQYYISINNRDIIETLATISCKSDL